VKELTNDTNQICKPVRFTRVQNYENIYLSSVPGQYLWDLWHTEWHCDRFFLRILWFSPSIVPPMLHSHSFIHHQCLITLATERRFERRPLRRDLRFCQRCSSGMRCDRFFLRILWFSPQYPSTNAPFSFIHPSPVPYNLSN